MCLEYRPVTSKGQVFSQDSPAMGVCILLKGEVEIKIESAEHTTRNLVVGHLKQYDAFGYIDILFKQHDPSLWKAIIDILKVDESNPLAHSLTLGYAEAESTVFGEDSNTAVDHTVPTASSGQHVSGPNQVPTVHEEHSTSTSSTSSLAGNSNNNNVGGIANHAHLAAGGALHAHAQHSHLNRARAPGMFATYNMTTLCELLIINAKEFHRILYNTAKDDFLKRLQVLHVCGVFSDLDWQDFVRLARMSQILTYNSGDIILKQGSKPKYIYFVVDGLCQVWAQANNAEIFERQLNELQEKARRHDLKYTYHHKLKTEYSRSDLPQVKNHKQISALYQLQQQRTALTTTSNSYQSTQQESKDLYMNLEWETNITSAEILRQELGLEIEQTKVKLARARAAEMANANYGTSGERSTWTAADAASQCEVKVLRWPMLFGEACALDPDTGTSRGTVVALSCCHVLAVHKTQIQTFHISDELLTKVRLRSVVYPNDKTIEQNLSKNKKWMEFREKEMSRIRKTRWPKLNSDQEPFTV
jgi:CRP-like cAMP-binding protein